MTVVVGKGIMEESEEGDAEATDRMATSGDVSEMDRARASGDIEATVGDVEATAGAGSYTASLKKESILW